MQELEAFVKTVSGLVWGVPLLILLVGTGVYLSISLKFLQFRKLFTAFAITLSKKPKETEQRAETEEDEGDISHFEALMTALAATIGTGNIVGVATAVVAGGPGAIFWMWLTALFGMATKYAEAVLAVRYREKNKRGGMSGGPMYYIKNGLNCRWLASLFALFGAVAAFGIGNMVQSNSIAMVIKANFGISEIYTGFFIMVLTGFVVLGGIKSIGKATGILVPGMAAIYLAGGLIVLFMQIDKVPAALSLILNDAFTGNAVAGGAIGTVIRFGVARGVFSNEAGLGSAPIAAAAAKTDIPGRQALVSMLGTFLDTIIVCSVTGITIVISGLWQDGSLNGAALTSQVFENVLPGLGSLIVTVGLVLFAYSTILGWCYYGEKCFEYLAGEKAVILYRAAYTLVVFFGAISSLSIVWDIADVFNGLMAIPNLIALLLLAKVVLAETKILEAKLQEEKLQEESNNI